MHSTHLGPSTSPGPDKTPGAVPPGTIRVVFFDAEGTLWGPRPGRTMKEFWRRPTREHARMVFQVSANVRSVLGRLKQSGCRLVVLSRHDEKLLPQLLEEFHLSTFFDDVLINGDKGERAIAWLKAQNMTPHNALMVGDREDLDILPLRRVGIHAVLVDRPYNERVDAPRLHDLEELIHWL